MGVTFASSDDSRGDQKLEYAAIRGMSKLDGVTTVTPVSTYFIPETSTGRGLKIL